MKRCTVEEFERFTELPENADRLFEYIGAEIRESISRPYASAVTAAINLYLHLFLEKQKSGYITGKKGGYMVSGDCYLPDLAYVSNARLPQLRVSGYLRNPPNLAVEVQSPIDADFQHFLRIKIAHYLAAGTMIWVLNPEAQAVEFYAPGQPVKVLGMSDTLDGGEVLPGFSLAVKDVFLNEEQASAE